MTRDDCKVVRLMQLWGLMPHLTGGGTLVSFLGTLKEYRGVRFLRHLSSCKDCRDNLWNIEPLGREGELMEDLDLCLSCLAQGGVRPSSRLA